MIILMVVRRQPTSVINLVFDLHLLLNFICIFKYTHNTSLLRVPVELDVDLLISGLLQRVPFKCRQIPAE